MGNKYQDPKFDKAAYWRNRKANIRGQASDAEYKATLQLRKVLAKKGAIGV